MKENSHFVKQEISAIETTDEKISGRAGLSLISRYISNIKIIDLLCRYFSFTKKSAKGTPLGSIFRQIICFFIDGTDFHLTYFDELKKDPSRAAIIETEERHMLSSHAAKRFFKSISRVRVWLFRKVLQNLFIWRLKKEKPEIIYIGLDTMVLDNDDANQREGVEPTYKKVKGFQPLQFFWGRFLIDAVFRNGKAHSNHGNHVKRSILTLTKLIRMYYDKKAKIVFIADTGFFSEEHLKYCTQLGVGLIVGGKIYSDIQKTIENMPANAFSEFKKEKRTWFYADFQDKRGCWDAPWRTIYTKPESDEEGQMIFDFARPETIIYTNIGMDNQITEQLLFTQKEDSDDMLSCEAIISAYHNRARDELINRGLKDFGTEHLPFKRFYANAAFYYLMCISFFLFEAFKTDMNHKAIPVTWYAKTFRRKCLDIAGKIIRSARRTILKVPKAVNEFLDIQKLWAACGAAPGILILRI